MLAAYREIVYEKIPRKMSRLFHGSANCQQIQYVRAYNIIMYQVAHRKRNKII